MTCSPACPAADRANPPQSTGPKSEGGKATSRGDAPGPGDDRDRVAGRAEAFARELGAAGAIGHLLARRAALLATRMEGLAEADLVAGAARVAAARAAFDADRAATIDALIGRLDEADPAPALAELQAAPDGVARLMAAWLDLLDRIRAETPHGDGAATRRAARWLGRAEPPADRAGLAELLGQVRDEVARLHRLADSLGPVAAALAAARDAAGLLARFDPGPAAALARRHEAAAERGMYRALRAIADLDRHRHHPAAPQPPPHPGPDPHHPAQPAAPTIPPAPAGVGPLGSSRAGDAGVAGPLGSSRAGAEAPLGSSRAAGEAAPIGPMGAGPDPDPARRARPDLRKFDRQLAANRR